MENDIKVESISTIFDSKNELLNFVQIFFCHTRYGFTNNENAIGSFTEEKLLTAVNAINRIWKVIVLMEVF